MTDPCSSNLKDGGRTTSTFSHDRYVGIRFENTYLDETTVYGDIDGGSETDNAEREVKTLWVGDLPYWVEESYLERAFSWLGAAISVKIIRSKTTGRSEGYGFVEFVNRTTAEHALCAHNGQVMPGMDQVWRLNWASLGAAAGPEFSLFVGDLAPDVNDFVLQETFRSVYRSVRSAKVVTDPVTGRSKGYGFVRFTALPDRNRALIEMPGRYCSSRPMRVSLATAKKPAPSTSHAQRQHAHAFPITPPDSPSPTIRGGLPRSAPGSRAYARSQHAGHAPHDAGNTTVFVGGLDKTVKEEELWVHFAPFGELVYVKIPQGKGCGFVQFMRRQDAETAMATLNQTHIGSQLVRLSWGRSPVGKFLPASCHQHGAFPDPGGFHSASPQYNEAFLPMGPASEAYGHQFLDGFGHLPIAHYGGTPSFLPQGATQALGGCYAYYGVHTLQPHPHAHVAHGFAGFQGSITTYSAYPGAGFVAEYAYPTARAQDTRTALQMGQNLLPHVHPHHLTSQAPHKQAYRKPPPALRRNPEKKIQPQIVQPHVTAPRPAPDAILPSPAGTEIEGKSETGERPCPPIDSLQTTPGPHNAMSASPSPLSTLNPSDGEVDQCAQGCGADCSLQPEIAALNAAFVALSHTPSIVPPIQSCNYPAPSLGDDRPTPTVA
mmetsp:Transcript_6156/g.11515  ORF Transcript_6156/g.11515 Transcript_6156/m.11515 type:complete len:660 (+) Transcript_6156:90-2069(+)